MFCPKLAQGFLAGPAHGSDEDITEAIRCKEGACAWWVDHQEQCSFRVIAEHINDIPDVIMRQDLGVRQKNGREPVIEPNHGGNPTNLF